MHLVKTYGLAVVIVGWFGIRVDLAVVVRWLKLQEKFGGLYRGKIVIDFWDQSVIQATIQEQATSAVQGTARDLKTLLRSGHSRQPISLQRLFLSSLRTTLQIDHSIPTVSYYEVEPRARC